MKKKQMQVLKDVCELRFRIDLLQDNMLAEILASMNCLDLSPDNPRHKEIFDNYIQRRDHISAVIRALFEIASPWGFRGTVLRKRDPDSLIAEDIWQSIRYQLWKDSPNRGKMGYTVDSNPPLQQSSEPVPTVRKVES